MALTATQRYNRWLENNRELANQRSREWRRKHPEVSQRWRKRNPEKSLAHCHVRRARLQGNGGTYTEAEWQSLKARYGHKCLRCSTPEHERPLTRDHVVPLSKGGNNSIENIQPLCKPCNTLKGVQSTDYRV